MPFKSKKQERWMFANKPEMAKRWASETNQSLLPESAPQSAIQKARKLRKGK